MEEALTWWNEHLLGGRSTWPWWEHFEWTLLDFHSHLLFLFDCELVCFIFLAISGLFLPAVVRPILDSFESSKQVPQPALSDVVAGMTGKK
uniref:Uncharacterized protein n=1 Tax=Nicotiana tabacum TaxID=4097 RepID=A0A1S3YLT2_TOBAC|nr:PREDICTED: uncharacterized protein LOC107777455 [Nicotiana tabacum]